MADFIDCYESIQTQINRINISQKSSQSIDKQVQNSNKQFIKILKFIMDEITNQNYYQIKQFDNDLYQFSFLYQQISHSYQIFVKIVIKKSQSQIFTFLNLLFNGIPIRFQQKSKRLLLNKLLLKINNSFTNGNFSIHPFSGQFILCLSNLFTINQFQTLFIQTTKFLNFINTELKKGKEYLNYFINNILSIFEKNLQNVSNPAVQDIHQFFGKILPYIHLEFPFMYTQKTNYLRKVATGEKSKQLINQIQYVKSKRRKFNKNLLYFIQKKKQITHLQNNKFFSKQDKQQCMKKLYPPIIYHKSGQPSCVFSQIQISNKNINWDIIDQGGFGVISKGYIQFVFPQFDRDKKFQRIVVKKDQSDPFKKKLQHQKQIVFKMKDDINPFIAKFYYSKQKIYKNSLLIDYYPQKSILRYFSSKKQFTSLNTKLFLLRYIAQGIKFLNDHNIYHLDLKPSNILIGSGKIRIIDFGEAYHPQVCNKYYRPGTSLPYAPPESYSPDIIRFSNKMDIFSFGVIAFQLLFGTYPFIWNKSMYEIFVQAYRNKRYEELIQFSPQRCNKIGYPELTQFLKSIIFKCLQKDQKKRPCIEWLIIILQNSIQLLNYL